MLQKKFLFGYAYVLSIILANFTVATFGIINIFGLVTPAGALFIGLTFSLRDFVQREFGHKVWYFMLASLVVTTSMSVVLSHLPIPLWRVALASAAAFLFSEATDWFVFTLLTKSFAKRIIISNLISIPIDSVLFVGIAFGLWGWEPAVIGQTVIKYVSGLLVLPFVLYWRKK